MPLLMPLAPPAGCDTHGTDGNSPLGNNSVTYATENQG